MLGTTLGNYRVIEKLGEGAMGVVYVGSHEVLGQRVVIKVLRPELTSHASVVRRFFNEAQAAAAIRHPGIVHVFDFGTASQRAYIVMELLEGETLTDRLARHRLEPAECCRFGRQIANVLHAAHTAGIIHRDLKPDNLFLVADPEVIGGERVKVLDFGIAKLVSEAAVAGFHTTTGVAMGTPRYMSPEQCRNASGADARSDIYSLGCILFEIACGHPPFTQDSVGDVIGAHLHTPPPAPHQLAPAVPTELSALILRMLAKPAGDRPQTMLAVSQALDDILASLGVPAQLSTPIRALAPEAGSSALPISAQAAQATTPRSIDEATTDVALPLELASTAVTSPPPVIAAALSSFDHATSPPSSIAPFAYEPSQPRAGAHPSPSSTPPTALPARTRATTAHPAPRSLPAAVLAAAQIVSLPPPAEPAPTAPRRRAANASTLQAWQATPPTSRPRARTPFILGGFVVTTAIAAIAFIASNDRKPPTSQVDYAQLPAPVASPTSASDPLSAARADTVLPVVAPDAQQTPSPAAARAPDPPPHSPKPHPPTTSPPSANPTCDRKTGPRSIRASLACSRSPQGSPATSPGKPRASAPPRPTSPV